MKNKHRISTPQPLPEDAVSETDEDLEVEKAVAAVVAKAVNITADDALAIRRLRSSLIEKLFTPERTSTSWTELKATN